MLLAEDARRQRLGGVVIAHWHGSLDDDGTAIELRRDEMHGHAGDLHAILDRLALSVYSRERGEERRMDVENGVRKGVDERRPNAPHEAGQAHQTHVARLQLTDELAVVIVARRPAAVIDVNGLETGTERYPASAGDIRRTILVHNPLAHGAVMLPRSLLDRHGVYDPAFLHNEDYDLWLRLDAAGTDMANIQEFLLRRRIHDRNITVARQRELVGYRCRTLAHAVFRYYRNPLLAVHLVRPAAAYLSRWGR